MSDLNRLKLALAALGVGVYFTSVRYGWNAFRWVGIALVAVAMLLRFVPRLRRRTADGDQPPSESR